MSNSALQQATARPWAVSRVNTRRNASDASCTTPARKNKKGCALECILCTERYSQEDVLAGRYQITTKVCSACYERMQALPHKVNCFGKSDFIILGKRLYGYSKTAHECQQLCPDRALCALVADPASYNPDA